MLHLDTARSSIPIIDEATLRARMTPALAVDVIRKAFQADGEGRARVPAVINLDVPAARGEFHVKTAFIDGVPHVAVKVASGFYDNPARGLPSGSGLMVLFDASTGFPQAILLDNGFLTDIRTAAAGAVAADVLARHTLDVVGVLGSGVQARHQIRCLAEVRRFRQVIAWSPTRENLERYCAEIAGPRIEAIASADPERVVRASDLLITATPSREPLVRAEWLKAGIHITAVGSDAPGKRELDPACLDGADLVVVDRFAQCSAFGELKHALDAGLLTRNDVHAELGAIVAGRKPGRTHDSEITIADLTGVGFQDTAIASEAYQICSHEDR